MESDVRNTLSKKERLSNARGLASLFAEGRYGHSDGIRYCWRAGNALPFNRIVVSVPKKCFKRAVKRNLLKRRIREAYRLNKSLLPTGPENGGTDILFIYNTAEILDFSTISASVKNILTTIAKKLATSPSAGSDTTVVANTTVLAGSVVSTETTQEEKA